MDQWGLEHQTYEYKEKPSKRFQSCYRYDPNQCILCGHYIRGLEDVQVK